MHRKSFNNALLIVSAAITVLVAAKPELAAYGMGEVTLSYPVSAIIASIVIGPLAHYGFFHFLSNAFLLLYFGKPIENTIGAKKYASFFAFVTIVSAVAALALETHRAIIGLDSFAMAVCAYTIVKMHQTKHPEIGGGYLFVLIFVGLDYANGYGIVANAAGLLAGLAFVFSERLLTKSD